MGLRAAVAAAAWASVWLAAASLIVLRAWRVAVPQDRVMDANAAGAPPSCGRDRVFAAA